ncbi:MAG TPA: amino acid permease, partial [Bacteroidota bacterium]|nr:amino acid permease [Bacteroidota bacterium]
LYGWTLFLVIQTGTIAAVGVAFAKFTAVLFPGLGETAVLFQAGPVKLTAQRLVAILNVAVLTFINTRGIVGGKWIQNTFTSAKTLALVALIALGLGAGIPLGVFRDNLGTFWNAATTRAGSGGLSVEPLAGLALLGALGAAMVGSLFSSDAWNNVTFTAGETVNPRRNIPLSLAIGTGSVTLLYILANVSYLAVLPVAGAPDAADAAGRGIQFAAADRVATAAMSVIMGPAAAVVMAVLIMISTFGCNNGLILSGARVYYAMARDGVFFRSAGRLNTRSVPGAALIVQGVWACLLCLSGTYGDLLDYVIFAVLLFYVLTVAGIFILRRTRPDAERPYRAFGYPVLPVLYIAAALAISVDLLILKPAYTWPGLGIVLFGIPVFYAWKVSRPARPE